MRDRSDGWSDLPSGTGPARPFAKGRRAALAALALIAASGPAGAADLGAGGGWRAATMPPVVMVAPAPGGLSGIVVSRAAGPLAYARVDAERTDRPSPRIPRGGFVTGPDGRFFIPLDQGLWTVGALAYGTWHRRPAVPVAEGLVTDLVIRVP